MTGQPFFHNVKKARKRWGMLARILDKDGATFFAKGMFYRSVIQSVLLYGVETWTVTPAMMRVLESFHHRVARRISGMMAHRVGDDWVYPPIGEALRRVGLRPIRDYVRSRQASIEDYVSTRPIFELCTSTRPRTGGSKATRWWQQDHTVASDDETDEEEDHWSP